MQLFVKNGKRDYFLYQAVGRHHPIWSSYPPVLHSYVPVVNWCEKKQFAAKGSKAYWTWAWIVIAILALTLISGIVLSVIAMNTDTVKGVFDAIAVGIASIS